MLMIQTGCGVKNTLLAEGLTIGVNYSGRALSNALQMWPTGTIYPMLIHLGP